MYVPCGSEQQQQQQTNLFPTGRELAEAVAEGRGQGTFVLMLCGDSLAPFLSDGDILTVDTAAAPAPFDAVLADLGAAAGYRCMLLAPDGGLWDVFGRRVAPGDYEIVGVVSQRSSRRVHERAQRIRSAFGTGSVRDGAAGS